MTRTKKTRVPKDQFKHLSVQAFDPGVINGLTVIQNEKLQKSKHITVNRELLMDQDQVIKQKILKTVNPWADVKLIPTSVYGIRR